MDVSGVVVMVLILGLVWGGFAYLLVLSSRADK